MFIIFFIHIIQLSLFISEYLPKAGKKVNFRSLLMKMYQKAPFLKNYKRKINAVFYRLIDYIYFMKIYLCWYLYWCKYDNQTFQFSTCINCSTFPQSPGCRPPSCCLCSRLQPTPRSLCKPAVSRSTAMQLSSNPLASSYLLIIWQGAIFQYLARSYLLIFSKELSSNIQQGAIF